jgi:hypothetical protein
MFMRSAYTEMMKYWVKFVACFLIAWLPLLGYPAQVAFCPQMLSPAAQLQMHASQMHSSHMSDAVPCSGDTHAPAGKPLAACHGMLGSLACGVPVIPTAYATAVVPSSPVYRAITRVLVEQFIPELPAPPPRSL